MKIPSAANVQKNAQVRLALFGNGLARNPRYLQFYDLYSHMLEHERIDPKRTREETLLDEVWDFLKSNGKLFTQAAREKGNPLRGKWHIAKQYMWIALEEEFFIRFPVKPIQLTTEWTNLAPAEIGATVTLSGKIVLGLIRAVSPDQGEIPSGQGMVVDLACSNRFLVSYDWADWESLSAKEKLHCICLDVNLQHPHMGYLLADFRSLLQPLKKHLTLNASNGGKSG